MQEDAGLGQSGGPRTGVTVERHFHSYRERMLARNHEIVPTGMPDYRADQFDNLTLIFTKSPVA
ncbi:hypothetical protein [Mycobacterium hubeiense]|uniref:hypothetical protein n=1 Tax=Mycobacterium hubeiense TaxID=1867256 RepID=UPI000C7F41E4|nr:hypothetical protein [Mycobacterium sp. QGD 101]